MNRKIKQENVSNGSLSRQSRNVHGTSTDSEELMEMEENNMTTLVPRLMETENASSRRSRTSLTTHADPEPMEIGPMNETVQIKREPTDPTDVYLSNNSTVLLGMTEGFDADATSPLLTLSTFPGHASTVSFSDVIDKIQVQSISRRAKSTAAEALNKTALVFVKPESVSNPSTSHKEMITQSVPIHNSPLAPGNSPPSSPDPVPVTASKSRGRRKSTIAPSSPPIATESRVRPASAITRLEAQNVGKLAKESKAQKPSQVTPTEVSRAKGDLPYDPCNVKNATRVKVEQIMVDFQPVMDQYRLDMETYKDEMQKYEQEISIGKVGSKPPTAPQLSRKLTKEELVLLTPKLPEWTLFARTKKKGNPAIAGFSQMVKNNNVIKRGILEAHEANVRAKTIGNPMGKLVVGNLDLARHDDTRKAIAMGLIAKGLVGIPKPLTAPKYPSQSMYTPSDYATSPNKTDRNKKVAKRVIPQPTTPPSSARRHGRQGTELSPISGPEKNLSPLETSFMQIEETSPGCGFLISKVPEPYSDDFFKSTIKEAQDYFTDLNIAIKTEKCSWKLAYSQKENRTLEATIPEFQNNEMKCMRRNGNKFGLCKANMSALDQLAAAALESNKIACLHGQQKSMRKKHHNDQYESPIQLDNHLNIFMNNFMEKLKADGLTLPPINDATIIGPPEKSGNENDRISNKDLPISKLDILQDFHGKRWDSVWRMLNDNTAITYRAALSLLSGRDISSDTLELLLVKMVATNQEAGQEFVEFIKWKELYNIRNDCSNSDFGNGSLMVSLVKSRLQKKNVEWIGCLICCPGVQMGIAKIVPLSCSITYFVAAQPEEDMETWAGTDKNKLRVLENLIFLKSFMEYIFGGTWCQAGVLHGIANEEWPYSEKFETADEIIQSKSIGLSPIHVAIWLDKKLPTQITNDNFIFDEECNIANIKSHDVRVVFLEFLERMRGA